MRLANKVAIVTGGASGIGKACAALFASEGARVVIGDSKPEEGEQVASQLSKSGGEVRSYSLDVSSSEQVDRMFNAAKETYGRVDILANAAGILFYGTALETTDADWDRVMNVNLRGTFFCCRSAIPIMIEGGGGSIMNFSSTTGAHDACAHAVAYVTSKGGIAAMTRALAIDHAHQGIRINAICPGPTDTPMLRKALSPEEVVNFEKTLPMKRLGLPSEIATAALFLASAESSFTTGSMLFVDGGQTAEV